MAETSILAHPLQPTATTHGTAEGGGDGDGGEQEAPEQRRGGEEAA